MTKKNREKKLPAKRTVVTDMTLSLVSLEKWESSASEKAFLLKINKELLSYPWQTTIDGGRITSNFIEIYFDLCT